VPPTVFTASENSKNKNLGFGRLCCGDSTDSGVIELASGFREKGSLGNSRDLKVLGSHKVRNGRGDRILSTFLKYLELLEIINISIGWSITTSTDVHRNT
jgi:hypothetical protein